MLLATIMIFFALNVPGSGPGSGEASLPSVQEVLDGFVQAVGGVEVLEAADQLVCTGQRTQELSWKTPTRQEAPFVALARADGSLRFAESDQLGQASEEQGRDLNRKLRWMLHPRLALVIEEYFPGLRVEGRRQWRGRWKILLTPEGLPADHYGLYFDEETGLLTHIGYFDELSGWRVHDGVLRPTRISFSRKGGHTTYEILEFQE